MHSILADLAQEVIHMEEGNFNQSPATERVAKHHQSLTEAVAALTREASDSNERLNTFQRLLEISDVGFFEFDDKGELIQANVRQGYLPLL